MALHEKLRGWDYRTIPQNGHPEASTTALLCSCRLIRQIKIPESQTILRPGSTTTLIKCPSASETPKTCLERPRKELSPSGEEVFQSRPIRPIASPVGEHVGSKGYAAAKPITPVSQNRITAITGHNHGSLILFLRYCQTLR